LRAVIAKHFEETRSQRAAHVLRHWAEMLPRFVKVYPHEYKRVLGVARCERPYVPAQVAMPAVMAQVQHG
jgi:glutamate synthase domain-containing protein 3